MKALIPITVLLLIAWLLGGAWWYSKTCCSSVVADAAATASIAKPVVAAAPTRQLAIADESRFRTTANDNLLFTNGGFDFNKPLSPELTKSYTELVNYLKANPTRSLKITGLYGKDEKNTSLLSNMGLARAANLKQYLEQLGVNGKQILTDSQMQDNFALDNGQLIGGLQYAFANMEAPAAAPKADDNRLAQIEKDLKANPIVLYFETAQSSIEVAETTRQKFADLIYYLEQKSDKKAIVTGHTDDVGAASINLKYGSERAEFAKSYLIKNGLNGNRIATASLGETKPVADNKTADGRAKNRRSEISIQ